MPGTRLTSLLRPLALAAGIAFLSLGVPGDAAAQLSGDMLGQMHTYKSHFDDTLLDIARSARLGSIELMSANPGVDPWLPGADVTILLPTAHLLPDAPKKGIVINTAELRLYYYGDPAHPLTFPIGEGRDGYLTPTGTTTVVRKKEKPSWYLTPSEIADHPELPPVVSPGDDNPLGDYAMYLGWHSYLIHGTNIPWGIGRRASRGCIRMYPEDIEWLYQRVPVGTTITVVDQPVKLGRMNGDLYIEVQPSSKQIDIMEETSKAPAPPEPLPIAEWSDRILVAAGPDIDRIDWPAVEKALADRQGYPIRIATSTDDAGSPAPTASPVDKPDLAVAAMPAPLATATASKPQDVAATPAKGTATPAGDKPAGSPQHGGKQSASTPAPVARASAAKSREASSQPAKAKSVKSAQAALAKPTPTKSASVSLPTPTSKPATGQQRTASR